MTIYLPIVRDALDELSGTELLDETDPSAGPFAAGFRFDRVVGHGSFAVTFRASATTSGRAAQTVSHPPEGARAVIKVFRPDMLAANKETLQIMLQKEIAALSRLSSRTPPVSSVVRLYASGNLPVVWTTDRGLRREVSVLPWLALEWVDGGPRGTTLGERIEFELRATGQSLAPARIARLARDLLRGLASLHEYGVVHRDIKPDNLLVCGEPPAELLKVTDLGIAAVRGLGKTFEVVVGSVGYMAPEQGDKSGLEGPHTDIFAFCCVLYEMLAGAMLFPNGPSDVVAPTRKSLVDAPKRHDSLQVTAANHLLAALDEVIAAGTSTVLPDGRSVFRKPPANHAPRLANFQVLAAELLPLLNDLELISGSTQRRPRLVRPAVQRARFTVLEQPSDGYPDEPLQHVVFVPDGTAIGSTGRALWYFDAREWRRAPNPAGALGEVVHMNGRHGGVFAVLGLDGSVAILSDNEWLRLPLPGQVGRIVAFAGRPDAGACLAAFAPDGLPYLAWFERGEFAGSHTLSSNVQVHSIVRVAGRYLAAGSIDQNGRRNGWLCMVGGKRGPEESVLETPPIRALDASGEQVVVGAGDQGTVIAWSVGDELICKVEACDKTALTSVVFDGEGAIWAAGGKHLYCVETIGHARVAVATAAVLPAPHVGLGVVLDRAVAAMASGRLVSATMTVDSPA